MHPSVQRALRLKPKQTGVYATEQGWVVEQPKTGRKELLVSFPKLKTHLHNEGILHEYVQTEKPVEVKQTVYTESILKEIDRLARVKEEESKVQVEETSIQEESDADESTEEESEVKADKPKRGRKPKVQE